MTLRSVHAAPYLLLAELGAGLLGGSAASAEERITLEVIGAVRMAGADVVRRADAAPGPTGARQAPAESAERTIGGVSTRRN